MRYTTLIDISEIPAVYGNRNARLLYLHMALRAGYHDEDRDVLAVSLRRLATDCGLSVSATRHALGVLTKAGLLKRGERGFQVLKWVAVPPPTPRTQAAAMKAAAAKAAAADKGLSQQLEKAEREAQEFERKALEAARTCTREQLEQWARELEDGKRPTHCGIRLQPNQDNINWLKARAAEK